MSNDGITHEEFLRVQEQLIELRNTNYELKEKLKKSLPSEPSCSKNEALQFANRLLNRNTSDKEKEVTKLEAEVDSLRAKMQQQEEEFRLQQQTFINELNKVVNQCEELQALKTSPECNKEIETAKQINENLHIKNTMLQSDNQKFQEVIKTHKAKITSLEAELSTQIAFVKSFEDTVLQLREEIQETASQHKNSLESKNGEIEASKESLSLANDRIHELEKSLKIKTNNLESFNLQMKEKSDEHLQEIERFQTVMAGKESEISNLHLKIAEMLAIIKEHQDNCQSIKNDFETEIDKLKRQLAKQNDDYEIKMNLYISDKNNLQTLTDELTSVNKENQKLLEKIQKLSSEIEEKEKEKEMILKKQKCLIKELQKAVNEERKRADSVEKLKERDWDVVEPDRRSAHTFDGNESVSSLSALESDNFELINKLSNLQKSYADVIDKMKHLEFENESIRKENLEKSEVIEHWIRSRSLPSNSSLQKHENPLRKFLATTLAGDDQVSDLKEMNKRLQRMLEETLSKNIILQRDLQTLIERTEM